MKNILPKKNKLLNYILLAIEVIVLTIFIATTIVICKDLNPVWSPSYEGIKVFTTMFLVPIQTLGVLGVIVTIHISLVAFKNSELQRERQFYLSFKSEFLTIFGEQNYNFKYFQVHPHSLFKLLYKDAVTGVNTLNPYIKRLYEDWNDPPAPYTIVGSIQYVTKGLKSKNGDRFALEYYTSIGKLYDILWHNLDIARYDPPISTYSLDELFVGRHAERLIDVFQEVYYLSTLFNIFESYKLMNLDAQKNWIGIIKQLRDVKSTAEKIQDYLNNIDTSDMNRYIICNDEKKVKELMHATTIPSEILNNDAAKSYVLEWFTKRRHNYQLSNSAIRVMATELGILT